MKNIAHVKQNEDGTWSTQEIIEHLQGTAEKAAKFAEPFGNQDWAYLLGSWHDLGKFLPAWQKRIRTQSGFDAEAHIEIENGLGRVNHSTAGAINAFIRFGENHRVARILAYPIAGHHAGLPDWYPDKAGGDLQNRVFDPLKDNIRDEEIKTIYQIPEVDKIFSVPLPESVPPFALEGKQKDKSQNAHLWIRMLFSCLVDADFLDTEEFMAPHKATIREGYPTISELQEKFDRFMERKVSEAIDTPINQKRKQVLGQCREKALLPPGFFSLTVPTGGGKTLSSMAFALKHALSHGKKRIVMAIPYTSIIEQTARVLKYGTDIDEEIQGLSQENLLFGEEAIVEHHSNLDPEKETAKNRLASENWDAPIIVTTNIQFFESVFASRPSSCRKLHNLVNSVIILDEAQMLPPEYLKPIISILKVLVQDYGVTVLFCTATQPAFSGSVGSSQTRFEGIPDCTEIIDDPVSLYADLKRVEIQFPDTDSVSTWEEITETLCEHEQAICIVNTRKDCRDLHRLMPENTIHLSGLMCAEERSEIISGVKQRLLDGSPVRVISTQLVEAGVDIDFPVVFRAMSGMDSIAQAAGRCNREGKLCPEGKLGKVIVFLPPKASPPGLLRKGEDAARMLIRNKHIVEFSPDLFQDYFKYYFALLNELDKSDFDSKLKRDACYFKFQFRTFSRNFNMIDNTRQKPVIVWYHGKFHDSRSLIEKLRWAGPNRLLLRQLQRFTVNMPFPAWRKLLDMGYIEEVHGFNVQSGDGLYRPGEGIVWEEGDWVKNNYIV